MSNRTQIHSLPWHETEMIHVDHQKLVYEQIPGKGIVVRFPGGKALPLKEVQARAHHVRIPIVWRIT